MHDSGIAVEKLITDGKPVPVVASYGMTSGFTPPNGITAPMLYYDAAHPPAAADIAGKILVFQAAPYPDPPYSNSFLDNYTLTDYEWRSPGKWAPLFTPPPASVTSSYHCRWVWSQVGGFAAIGIKGGAAGIVIVYDLSPGAAFGLVQRSVYTPDGKAGLGAKYSNCPTLTLDRVNGAQVLADAKAGKTATLTLTARFQRDTGKSIIARLPGKNYGTPQDEQVLLSTHTDAMSLIEDNGGLGMLGIMSYFNRLPRSARPRTLVFYFDCRHFMPGGEASWPQFDYYTIHPDRLKPVMATMGIEHMGGRQTVELGPDGNQYAYSQVDTEAGPNGFDKDYFVQQVAGLTQLAGEFMLVHPRVIDLGWGTLKSELVNLPDSGFVARPPAAHRATLLKQYVAAFRQVETAALDQARSTLHELAEHIAVAIAPGRRDALAALVDAQLAKLKS